MNPFERISGLPEIGEIEDIALRRASKGAMKIPYSRGRAITARRREVERIKILSSTLNRYFGVAVKIGEAYEGAEEFYRRLGDLTLDGGGVIESTKRLRGTLKVLGALREKYLGRLRRRVTARRASEIRREAYGRMISVLKRRRRELELLGSLWEKMHILPSIDSRTPTVVVAGAPNVGKSSLVKAISTARVEVAGYPFTTKEISVGHVKRGMKTVQVIDTPGLLDRPMKDRNAVERRAILCLEHVADHILYLFDPSPEKYYPLDEQLNIYREIKSCFERVPVVPVINKMDSVVDGIDLLDAELGEKRFEVSTVRGDDLKDLVDWLFQAIKRDGAI
jgi:nucleolar GTP-binding protein